MNPWAWVIPLALGLAIAGIAAYFGVKGINALIKPKKKPVQKRRVQRKPKPKPESE